MIFYSDFILSQKPWSFCRLDEPVGYNLYLDSSGNGNHLKALSDEDVITNQQIITFSGDPFIAGVRPNIQKLSLDKIDFEIDNNSLQLEVPLFKSDTYTFKRREKIQNHLSVNSLWIDVLMNIETPNYHLTMKNWLPSINFTNNERLFAEHLYLSGEFDHSDGLSGERLSTNLSLNAQSHIQYETFIRIGSLALVGASGVHYNTNGAFIGNSFRLILVTRILVNGNWLEKFLWSRLLVSENSLSNPPSPLSTGTHRFTLGIINPTSSSITIKISIDGNEPFIDTVILSENESFEVYDHNVYSKIALMNNTAFSSLSVFFNKPFPSNDWLSASQKALTRDYQPPVCEDISILHGIAPSGYPMLEKLPGSLLNILNGILFLGTNHRIVHEIYPSSNAVFSVRITPEIPGIAIGHTIKINDNKQSPFSGCWKISELNTNKQITINPALLTTIPSKITLNSIDYNCSYQFTNKDFLLVLRTKDQHFFNRKDLVTVHHLTDSIQSHTWTVTSVDEDGFNITAQGISNTVVFNDDCIVKQTPIGGGSWTKTFSDNVVGFGYKEIEAHKKNILIDDREPVYSEIRLSEIDNSSPSNKLYITKDIKSLANHEKDRLPSKSVGDCHRLYCFLASKQNTISQTSLICFGEVFDWFNQDWCVIAMVSISKNKDQDIGFNYAFLYPDWSIDQKTGFLICRSFKSHLSDGRVLIKENGNIVPAEQASITGQFVYPYTLPGDRVPSEGQPPASLRQFWTSDGQINMTSAFGDSGQHVYPINIPFISFVPS